MLFRSQSGNLALQLRNLAYDNGLSFSDQYFEQAARSVASGLKTADDFAGEIREQAAGRWPVFSEQIRAGVSARALASPYMNIIADEFEIPVENVSLSDPYVARALGGFTAEGAPQAENLWDFTKRLRQDPRWPKTLKAQNEITGTLGSVMRMFGMMGG